MFQTTNQVYISIPSGKQPHNYGKSPFSMGKSTINHHFIMISSTILTLSFRTWLAAARSALCRYPGRSPPRLRPPMALKVAFFMGENEQNHGN
jgi:hypothetical protein